MSGPIAKPKLEALIKTSVDRAMLAVPTDAQGKPLVQTMEAMGLWIKLHPVMAKAIADTDVKGLRDWIEDLAQAELKAAAGIITQEELTTARTWLADNITIFYKGMRPFFENPGFQKPAANEKSFVPQKLKDDDYKKMAAATVNTLSDSMQQSVKAVIPNPTRIEDVAGLKQAFYDITMKAPVQRNPDVPLETYVDAMESVSSGVRNNIEQREAIRHLPERIRADTDAIVEYYIYDRLGFNVRDKIAMEYGDIADALKEGEATLKEHRIEGFQAIGETVKKRAFENLEGLLKQCFQQASPDGKPLGG